MKTCSACGRQNPDDRDFCECGEYLRWEPTGFMQAVEAPAAAATPAAPAPPAAAAPPPPPPPPPGAAAPPPPPPPAAPAPPPPPAPPAPPGNGAAAPPPAPAAPPLPAPAAPAPPPVTAVHAPPPAPAPVEEPAPQLASITLRLPDVDATPGETVGVSVDPGQRAYVVALVRNASGIVDNYTVRVDGIPDTWFSVMPNPVYLVPYGTAGNYEQEVQIHLHPPRSPEAEAKVWQLQVVAESAAYSSRAAAAPLILGIQPYEEFEPKLKPEKVSGRKSAQFDVVVRNKANAPVDVAMGITDPEQLLEADFEGSRRVEIPAGETKTTKMTVKPPKQIWIGRPVEHRFEVLTRTGEAADELLAEDEVLDEEYEDEDLYEDEESAESGGGGSDRKAAAKKRGARYKPRVTGPRVQVGPGGVRATGPRASAAKPRAPRVPSKSFDLNSLKRSGGGAAAAPAYTGPLLPTQAVFRQKPWIPRWAAVLFLLLILLAVLLFLLIPRTVAVPDLKGKKVFDATKSLTEAELALDPKIDEKVAPNLPPGTIIDQTPAPGKKVKKQSQVHVVTAIGTGNKSVPNVVGKTLTEANTLIEKKGLVVGAVNPQPPDPEGKVKSQIPLAGEVAKEGKPIQLFLETKADKAKAGGTAPGDEGGEGQPGGDAKPVVIPAIGEDELEAYAQKVAELGLTPVKQVSFSDTAKAGALFGTDPAGGTEVEPGSTVKLLVSAGFPQIAYDNDKDLLLVNGADGKKLETIAKSPRIEKEPAFTMSGAGLAFISAAKPPADGIGSAEGIIQLSNREKPDQAPVPLTPQGEKWRVPSFAPTADANVLAALKITGAQDAENGDVCIGAVDKSGYSPKCLDDGGLDAKRVLRWAPDGKSMYTFAVKEGGGTFGMVRFTTKTPYSPNADDWSKGKFVTDISEKNKGVLDLAISPDGKRMAAVTNFGAAAAGFTLSFAQPGDFLLAKAKPTSVEACKLTWRPDSLEVAVVQADNCEDGVGDIARVDARNPSKLTTLKAGADSPAYQPVLPEEAK